MLTYNSYPYVEYAIMTEYRVFVGEGVVIAEWIDRVGVKGWHLSRLKECEIVKLFNLFKRN